MAFMKIVTGSVVLLAMLSLLPGCVAPAPQPKTVTIMVANEDGQPIRRQNIGQCAFYADYSFKITSDRPEVVNKLTAAIKRARQKESLLLRTEEKKGDTLVMSGEYLKPGDQNYLHALIIESARLLNEDSPGQYFSLE
jgi:hypothetical protein